MRRNRKGLTVIELIIVIVILLLLLAMFCAGPIAVITFSKDMPTAQNPLREQRGITEFDLVRADDPPLSCTGHDNSYRAQYRDENQKLITVDVCYNAMTDAYTITDVE